MATELEILAALVEKQNRLIVVQAQLLARARDFGDEGTSELHREVSTLTTEISELKRRQRAAMPRPSAVARRAF